MIFHCISAVATRCSVKQRTECGHLVAMAFHHLAESIVIYLLALAGLETQSPKRAPSAYQQPPPKGQLAQATRTPQPPVKPSVSPAAPAARAAGLGPGVARILRPAGTIYAAELPSRLLTVGGRPQAAGCGPGSGSGQRSGQEPAEGAKPATTFARKALGAEVALRRGAAGGPAGPEGQGLRSVSAAGWGDGEPRQDEAAAAEGAAGPDAGKVKRCVPALIYVRVLDVSGL